MREMDVQVCPPLPGRESGSRRGWTLIALTWACALLGAALAMPCRAGQNAGAHARIYWLQDDTTAVRGSNSGAGKVRGLVTCSGLHSLRGMDVQIVVQPTNLDFYPQAWQAQPGGPAWGNFTASPGGFGLGSAAKWPNALTAGPALPEVVVGQPGYLRYPPLSVGMCAVCLSGVIWYSASGSGGVPRNPTTEYGVFGFTLDLTSGLQGDATDPSGPQPMTICPDWRLPCSGVTDFGNALALVDSSGATDYAAFINGYNSLTWHQERATIFSYGLYVCSAPVRPTTWGRVKRLYR